MILRSVLLSLSLLLSSTSLFAGEKFLLPDLEGRNHQLSDYRGKWVVINYWATWCPPCLAEIPDLVKFHNRHKSKTAVVLGVNFESISLMKLRDFVRAKAIGYPILTEQPGPDGQFGYIPGLPVTYLISPQGELVAEHVGMVTAEMLEKVIASKKAELASAL